MRDELETWAIPAQHASIFGSVARGDGDAASDVDLLVVRPAEISDDDPRWRSQVDGIASSIRRWTGNSASISELSEDDVDRLARERPPVVEAISSDAITLLGLDPQRLFRTSAT